MLIEKLNKLLPLNIKIKLFSLLLLSVLTALIELVSIGSIPLFINHIVSDTLEVKLLDFNFEKFLFFLPFDNISIKFSFVIILVFLIKFIYLIYFNYFELNLNKHIQIFLSKKLYNSYVNRNYLFHLKNNTSDLIRNVLTETASASTYLISILNVFKEFLIILTISFLVILFNPLTSLLVIFFGTTLLIIFYFLTNKFLKKLLEKKIKFISSMIKHFNETFDLIKKIKIYSKEQIFKNNFYSIKSNFENTLYVRDFIVKLPKIIFEFMGIILIVILLVVSTLQQEDSSKLIASLSVLTIAIIRLLPSFNQLSSSLGNLSSLRISLDIIFKEILTSNSDQYINHTKKNFYEKTKNGELISFENVKFSYDKETNVGLKNISFSINKNEMIGIVGRSGSGKTTIVNLLLKLIKPQNGKIKFLDDKTLCAYVPQDIVLTDDTLKSNIAFAENNYQINENKLKVSIIKSDLTSFVDTHKKGTDLILGERGVRVSGGEKQRIGLARAIYQDKPIIVFDEATSSLDNQTEKNILNSIIKIKKEKTLIIIAHRLSTLKNCDKVIYIENGQVKDQGKLDELLIKYPEIENKNFSEKDYEEDNNIN